MIERLVQKLLRKTIGLEPEAVPPRYVSRAIDGRMKALGMDDQATYLTLLTANSRELAHLIEGLVVSETWFFRDTEPFRFMARHLTETKLSEPGGSRLRILSVPCATGEEPFSVAMTLLDLGLGPKEALIDAVDISSLALDKARRGVFPKTSFREKSTLFRNRYFTPHPEGWRIEPRVREMVEFHQGNILSLSGLRLNNPYDLIFCRNLLIYLNDRAREKVLAQVERLLKPGGLVFLGYAEARQVFFPDYLPAGPPRAYAGLKPMPGAEPVPQPAAPPEPVRRKPPKAERAKPQARPKPVRPQPPERPRPQYRPEPKPDPAPATNPERILSRSKRLADEGCLDEALELCQKILADDPTLVEAHLLVGLISSAQGDDDLAEVHFNRTLYLAPDNIEALAHLSLLLDRQGKVELAGRCRERLERCRVRLEEGG